MKNNSLRPFTNLNLLFFLKNSVSFRLRGNPSFSPKFNQKMQTEPISWADFEKVEILTGTIVEANDFPKARKPAYQLTIDFGPRGIRRSSAQITTLYQREELIGRQVVAVVNFPPKQIATFISECLVLGAVAPDGTVTLLTTERVTENGTRIG